MPGGGAVSRAAFESALRGDHEPARARLADPALDPGWALALRATLPDAAGAARPTVDEVTRAEGEPEALALAAAQCARFAFARRDPDALSAWRDALDCGGPGPALALVEAQLGLLRSEPLEDAPLAQAEAEATRAALAPTVVDLASTRALLALERGEREVARHHARRAVRMSRTEELPLQQYLAGVALARVRRFDQRPHMALRILTALAGVAPAALADWIAHERRLAGEPARWRDDAVGRLDEIEALTSRAPCAWVRQELEVVRALLVPDPSSPRVTSWCLGRAHEVPLGLLALATSEHPALALLTPAGATRVMASASVARPEELLQTSRPGRLETAICVLAFAAEPLETETFFAEVYGFEFEPAIHRGALEVLVHRLRELLGDRAAIARDRGALRLVVSSPFAVPDPRVRRSLDEALLSSLAQHPDATARESATHAGAPLRSVQHALKRLVEEGVCEARKRGRVVCYRIEDTTFTEPTSVVHWKQS